MSFLFPSPTITFEAALRDLAQGSAKARAAAAHALGDVTEPTDQRRAVDALLRALDDDRGDVRAEACASLGELRDARALSALIRRLDDGAPPVRQAAAIALGSIGQAEAFEALALALREGPPDLRFQAATSLAEIDAALAYEPLVAALDDADPQVLSAIALALGVIGDGRAAGHLARLLDHGEPLVRFEASYALAELGDGRGRASLIGALADAEKGWDAAVALEKLGTPADADALAGSLTLRGVAPQVQIRAAGALLRTAPRHAQAEAARRVLLAALRLRRVNLRGLAIEQLMIVGGPWAEEPLALLREHRRGRDFVDEIDEALTAIRARSRT